MYLEAPRHLPTKDRNQNLQKSTAFLWINCSIGEEQNLYWKAEVLKDQDFSGEFVFPLFFCLKLNPKAKLHTEKN